MADKKKKLGSDYQYVTKFDPAFGPFATVQVLMKGRNEIATIRNGKVVESSDSSIASVGETAPVLPDENKKPQSSKPSQGTQKAQPQAKSVLDGLPPEVYVSSLKGMSPDNLQAALEAAQKRADAVTKLYQNTPSSDTEYAQIKAANDGAINDLNKIKDAMGSANKPTASASTQASPTSDTTSQLAQWANAGPGLDIARQNAQDAVNRARVEMDAYEIGSKQYTAAKKDLIAAQKQLDAISQQGQKSSSAQQSVAAKNQATAATEAQGAVDKAQKDLNAAVQRAKDKGYDNPSQDPNVQSKQEALNAAQKKATQVQSSSLTSDVSITGNKLNAQQTAAFESVAKPVPQTDETIGAGAGAGGAGSGKSTGGGSAGTTPTYSKTAPSGAVGVDSAGNWVNAQGKVLGTSVTPAISMMPKGAVGIENGNWVDAKGKSLGSATPTGANGQTPNQTAYEKFRQQYGSEAAIIDSNPELKAAFNQALSAPGAALSTPQWQAIYENSNYYKNSYSSFLNAEQTRLAQPGAYVQAYNKAITDVKKYAAEAGISLDWSSPDLQPISATPGQSTNPLANKQFDPTKPGIIDDILHKYWDTGANQTAITQYIASKGKIDPTIMGGAAQSNEEQLRAYAAELGLSNYSLPTLAGGDYFNNAATQIAQGGMVNGTPTDLNYWKQDLKNKAKDVYGGKYNTQLDAGQTIKSLAAPYINTLTSLLESSPDTINLSDPNGDGALIRNAMQKGTTPEDFAKQVMNDPRWLTTRNAKSSLLGIGNQFLSAFGLSALG